MINLRDARHPGGDEQQEEESIMKLYNSFGMNPRMVRMFCIEKGIDLETVEIDLLGGENRRAP